MQIAGNITSWTKRNLNYVLAYRKDKRNETDKVLAPTLDNQLCRVELFALEWAGLGLSWGVLRMNQSTDALAPCPHCGAVPMDHAIESHKHAMKLDGWPVMPDHGGSHVIECGCGAGMIDETRKTVLARWNRRATPPAPPAVHAPGEDALEIMEQIARQWDDCLFDTPGGNIDIGEAIRSAWNYLASDPAAGAQKAAESPQGAGPRSITRRTDEAPIGWGDDEHFDHIVASTGFHGSLELCAQQGATTMANSTDALAGSQYHDPARVVAWDAAGEDITAFIYATGAQKAQGEREAFDAWRSSPACEEACAAIRRSDPTTALIAAFQAGRASIAADVQDAKRFAWYFSDKPKGDWLMTYLNGMRQGWTTDQWRDAIDAAIAATPQEPHE